MFTYEKNVCTRPILGSRTDAKGRTIPLVSRSAPGVGRSVQNGLGDLTYLRSVLWQGEHHSDPLAGLFTPFSHSGAAGMAALIHVLLPGDIWPDCRPGSHLIIKNLQQKSNPRVEILSAAPPPLDFCNQYDIISYYGQEAIYGERYIMQKIAIVTDSNSGITQAQSKQLGVWVLPMPFYINDELFLEDITLTQEQFYDYLAQGADVKTSQPAPGDVTELWDTLLKDHDAVVHIPMSSGLSSSCQTAQILADDYDGRVQVVNNQRISVTQLQSVMDAKTMAEKGWTAAEIKEELERTKFDSDIYITVDTLKYLKKGGRLTPAAAAIGTVLNLKPVLRIKGEKLDAFSKTRGWKAAKKAMIEAVRHTMDTDFADSQGPENLYVAAAYTGDADSAQEWKHELEEAFPGYEIYMAPLSLSVACHIGPGARAVTVTKLLHIRDRR